MQKMSSLNRGLEIMEYIILNRCASVTEISQVFKIDKSTASRILTVLAEHNLVCKAGNTMKYYPSIGTLLFSSRTMANYQILDEVHPILRRLADAVDMTAQVCVLKKDRVCLLDQVKSRSNRFLKEPALPGMAEPLHCSAIGKCVMAYMPSDEYDTLMETYELRRYTDATITDRTSLERELVSIRAAGYALDRGELADNLYCIAVPIMDRNGTITFSLGVSGKKEFLENEVLFETILRETKKAANQISQKYLASDMI